MPRPIKPRRIGFIPNNKIFTPQVNNHSDVIILLHDELEALRLKDIENLNQNECAEIMDISRQTFQLILDSAHSKVANALVEGKTLKIEGGNYIISECIYRCSHCGRLHKTDTIKNDICNRRKRCLARYDK